MLNKRYRYDGKIFGVLSLSVPDLSREQLYWMGAMALASNLSAIALATWGFQFLWAWYVPVFWAEAPMLGYWHSLVTMVMLGGLLRRSVVKKEAG